MKKNICLTAFLVISLLAKTQEYRSFPMWNESLSFETRVNDVVSRLTLEEKVAQMLNAAPAVARLGIPAYDWWNEVLHGVARVPYHTTSYPQAIGMAATWDTNALKIMAHYSALEGRAVYNKATAEGRNHERYMGITYWTPNINIFRDPRWGRGQETYGEDPFLTASLGSAFVRGLQGEDGKYLKAAACAKHFAVHSGPEPSRHSDNFNPSPYDLYDTYLPAFKQLITQANVAGVMCAYNAVNTQPCCANDFLMNDLLRNQWKFTGYVTSDCWAVDDFYKYHKSHPDAISSAVDAVVHGTDLECGRTVYATLTNAVKTGMITEAQLDVSLKRLFMIRYRLGMFDNPNNVPYAQTGEQVLESAAHAAHALKMARESIVLLRNENNTLPLKKTARKIVVLGPNADNKIAVLGNYNGTPSKVVSVLDGLKEKLGKGVDIVYEKAINFTNDTLLVLDESNSLFAMDGKPGFRASYYGNKSLEGTPTLVRHENALDHFWAEGVAPAQGLPASHYSARFESVIHAKQYETINLEVEGDNGYKLYINDSVVADAWERNRWGAKQIPLQLEAGKAYHIKLEWFQSEGFAQVRLQTGKYEKTDFQKLAKKYSDADAIVFVGGISPQLEGEEMKVPFPGFNGGDRTSILLPAVQTKLMQALQKTGKPVVFVMMTGSAIATPWESNNIPAIVNAWYGGQSAGTAIADVLFGDYNPAGRLPVTFYASDKDLPDFMSYDMSNRTYRYFKGQALYPFGYGLSYTSFHYNKLVANHNTATGKQLEIKTTITNSGQLDGDEVVQLYISYPDVKGKAPIRILKGFQRIHLKANEAKEVAFTLTAEDLMLVNEQGENYMPRGKITISVGGGQPGQNITASSNVLQQSVSWLN